EGALRITQASSVRDQDGRAARAVLGAEDFRFLQDGEEALVGRTGADRAGEVLLRTGDLGRIEQQVAEPVDARLELARAAVAIGEHPELLGVAGQEVETAEPGL